ncbi:MAG TPA: HAMP domain-containing protein, partial [Polyangiaceae bacterium]
MSLGTRLALTIGAVLLVLSALLFSELTTRERGGILHSKQVAAANVSDLFADSVSAALDFSDTAAIDHEITDFTTSYDVTCAAVWQGDDSKPIAASKSGQCIELLAPKNEALGLTATFPDRLEVARAVTAHGKSVGRTLLVFSLARENETIAASRLRLLALFAFLTAGSAILLVFVVRRQVLTPVSALVDAARRVGMGDYKARVPVASKDEVGMLSRAFNAMGEAVDDRETKLEAATKSLRDLFGAMRQVIVAFDVNGRIEGEVSRAAAEVFGTKQLEGKDVRMLMYQNRRAQDIDAKAFDEWMQVAFELPPDRWAEVATLAPGELELRRKEGGDRILELEFRPIVQASKVRRVMMLATDVTEARRLKKTVREQEEAHQKRMAAMRRLLAGGGQVFVSFLEGSKERLMRSASILAKSVREKQMSSAQIDELFRHAHTIKSEARAFDLNELEFAAQALEAMLEKLRGDARSGKVPGSEAAKVTLLLDRVRPELDRAADVFVGASPIGRAALDTATVQRSDINELIDWVRTSERALPAMRKSGPLSKLVTITDRLASRPFGESTLMLVEGAPTWAEREGKKVRIEVEGREVRMPPKLASSVGPALVHLVRNSIAHGIEMPGVRSERGKPEVGIIKLTAIEGGEAGPTVTIEDDGNGLDREKILGRAEALNDSSELGVAEIIFHPGFSTAGPKSSLAGRGVGLGAVRQDLGRIDYTIEVHTQAGKMTRFVLRPLSTPLG